MTKSKARVAVFISGGGSNLQSLIDASKSGILDAEIAWVVSGRRDAFGLERAAKAGIESFVFKMIRYDTPQEAGADLFGKLKERKIDYIALAGYLNLLPSAVVTAYRNRIVNIHPALLPKYGGKGMYGHHVHEAVIAAGDAESGVSFHIVDEVYDNGPVIAQSRVPVQPGDTPETLAARVLELEHKLYPRVLNKLIKGEYKLDHE